MCVYLSLSSLFLSRSWLLSAIFMSLLIIDGGQLLKTPKHLGDRLLRNFSSCELTETLPKFIKRRNTCSSSLSGGKQWRGSSRVVLSQRTSMMRRIQNFTLQLRYQPLSPLSSDRRRRADWLSNYVATSLALSSSARWHFSGSDDFYRYNVLKLRLIQNFNLGQFQSF